MCVLTAMFKTASVLTLVLRHNYSPSRHELSPSRHALCIQKRCLLHHLPSAIVFFDISHPKTMNLHYQINKLPLYIPNLKYYTIKKAPKTNPFLPKIKKHISHLQYMKKQNARAKNKQKTLTKGVPHHFTI